MASLLSQDLQDELIDVNHQAREGIDEEIIRLYEEIRRLRSRRNALAPISRLPADVLRLVFLYTRFNDTSKMALVLTWVSRDWRELALSIHRLWAKITFTHPEWIQTAISRACTIDLDISLNLSDPQPPSIPQILIDHLVRAQQFHIFAQDSVEIDTSNIGKPHPPFSHLETISLREVKLVGGFLASSLPALKHLYLGQCHFDWTRLPALPNLTSLYVDRPSELVDVRQFVRILRTTPELEFLSLSKSLANSESVLSVSPARLSLPKLKSIFFNKVWLDAGCQLFNSIQVLDTTKGRFDLYANRTPDALAIVDSFVGCRAALTVSPSLTIQTTNGIQKIALNGAYYYLRMSSYPEIIPIINTIGRCVSLVDLEEVTLTGWDHTLDPAQFCQIFKTFTSVKSFSIGGVYVEFFLSSIALQNEAFAKRLSSGHGHLAGGDEDAYNQEPLVFHGLNMLTVGEGYLPVAEDIYLGDLPIWLRYQKAMGVELKFLGIHMIEVPVEVKSELEGLVVEAFWEK